MPADTTVKHFDSSMTGAPQITVASSTSAGKLIDVIRACCVDGFGLVTLTSLVVSGGIATGTVAAGQPFRLDTVALLAGSTPAGLNGEKKILSATGQTFTFDATGIPDQTATGTITAKFAPAGWLAPFAGTNLLAIKSGDAGASQGLARIDDTNATDARVVAYESMSDINTGVGKTPSDVQLAGGGFITRGNTNAGVRKWWIVANARWVYVGIAYSSSYPDAYLVSAFGDIASRKSGDAYKFSLFCQSSSKAAANPDPSNSTPFNLSTGTVATVALRSYTQTGGPIVLAVGWARLSTTQTSAASGTNSGMHSAYPNGPDNALILSEVSVQEVVAACYRGVLPGGYACPQNVSSAFQQDERVTGVPTLSGRTLLAKNLAAITAAGYGWAFIDITGPWAT